MSSLYNNAIFVSSLKQLPAGEHWVILEDSSIHIPGDERSQTNPGHGYPERNEPMIRYIAFTVKSDFEAELIERAKSYTHQNVIGIHITSERFTTIPSVQVQVVG